MLESWDATAAEARDADREALELNEHLAALYEAWGKPERASRYRPDLVPNGAGSVVP